MATQTLPVLEKGENTLSLMKKIYCSAENTKYVDRQWLELDYQTARVRGPLILNIETQEKDTRDKDTQEKDIRTVSYKFPILNQTRDAIEAGIERLKVSANPDLVKSSMEFERQFKELAEKVKQHSVVKETLRDRFKELFAKQKTALSTIIEQVNIAKKPGDMANSAPFREAVSTQQARLDTLTNDIRKAKTDQLNTKKALEELYKQVYLTLSLTDRAGLVPPSGIDVPKVNRQR